MSWESVIGLEIHTQLKTQSKIFSSTSAAFSAEPNAHANGVDIALPGTLPVLNVAAVRLAVRFGLAIGAHIAPVCQFDRKNYFYPDLPKGYQISQLDHPIVGRGRIELEMPNGSTRTVGITRAHLEEDAGRSLHEAVPGHTGIDLNRAGTPLLEIVTEPDLRTPEEAAQLFRQVHELVVWHDICDGKLNEGSMRCDANVSVRKRGETTLGERTEIKNINSFEFLEAAIRGEIERQIAILERGDTVLRQTLRYDPDRDATTPMRGKEQSQDYRYFPEPDLLPVETTRLRNEEIVRLGEGPSDLRKRFRKMPSLSEMDVQHMTDSPVMASLFEDLIKMGCPPKLTANRLIELQVMCFHNGVAFPPERLTVGDLAEIIKRQEARTLTTSNARKVVEVFVSAGKIEFVGGTPEVRIDRVIRDHDISDVSDTDTLSKLIAEVVAANPKQVEQYRAGKDKVFGFFVGQVMKQTGGKANPQQLNELLRKALSG
jgi:aspartyl-tRNA(Asn)/glutamyl-tRNA(Gln) amidotransferase subunit B